MSKPASAPSVIYVPMLSYEGPPYPRSVASAEIGFGRTSSGALVSALRALGVTVHVVPANSTFPAGGTPAANAWRAHAYDEVVRSAGELRPDVLLVFHIFSQFATEIRRGLLDSGLAIPMAGFLHGSHWDLTDHFRQVHYPGLDLAELGNIAALDRLYCPSRYMQSEVIGRISSVNGALGEALLGRSRVLGIPYPADSIAAAPRREREPGEPVRIVFNHALIPSKRPDLFVAFIEQISDRRPGQVEVIITRGPEDSWGDELVAKLDSAMVTIAGTRSTADYHAILHASDIQVSTAEHEGLGVATLEAMAAGCCCVVPDIGAYPELMAATPEALYNGTVDGLTDLVDEFIAAPARRAAVAARQAAHVTRWSPDALAVEMANDLADLARTGYQPLRLADWLPE